MATWVNYSFVTNQSTTVSDPRSAVKSVLDKDGNPQTVVFIKADSKPGKHPGTGSARGGAWPEAHPSTEGGTATIRRGGDRYLGYPRT